MTTKELVEAYQSARTDYDRHKDMQEKFQAVVDHNRSEAMRYFRIMSLLSSICEEFHGESIEAILMREEKGGEENGV